MKKRAYWIAAGLLPVILLAADILVGSSGISPSDVWKSLCGGEVSEQTRTVVIDIRLMKAVTALLAGISVSVSGLMMQTLFRNPLAGPYGNPSSPQSALLERRGRELPAYLRSSPLSAGKSRT